jgi:hypothetical protein
MIAKTQQALNALEQQYGQKFSDIEQVLNFLIQKDKKTLTQQQRAEFNR